MPDPKHEALRDLVRAREAAKQDTKRAKHRLGKYLLRYGQRPPSGSRAWTAAWWQWVRKLELLHPEQNTTLIELILEVDHQSNRIERFDGAIDRAVASAAEQLRAILAALQSLREPSSKLCGARSASPVRGSSRRMMTMMAAPADPRISVVINRRQSAYLAR